MLRGWLCENGVDPVKLGDQVEGKCSQRDDDEGKVANGDG